MTQALHAGAEQAVFAAVGRRLFRYALALDGAIREVDACDMPLAVQYACFQPRLGLLYVACSNGGVGQLGDKHQLVVVDASAVPMRVVGDAIALPHRPIHAAHDEAGGSLLVAYNRPAALTVHALCDAGLPGSAYTTVADPELVGCFPHQVLPLPRGGAVLLTCRGDDAVAGQAENPGSLRVLRLPPDGPALVQTVAPRGGFGFGPRNCRFHPALPVLYAVLERQNQLAWFRFGEDGITPDMAGALELLERPDALVRPQLGGDLLLHPGGRFAYAVNRSHSVIRHGERMVRGGGENSVAVFDLDAETGEPRLLAHAALPGLHARCIAWAHGGRLLVAAIRQDSAFRSEAGIVECPAGFGVFGVQPSGRLILLRHHAVEVGGDQLFWAGTADA